MAIKVIYPDGSCGVITSSALEYLIEKREVVAFKRSDGWARLGRDKMRSRQQPINGADKRKK